MKYLITFIVGFVIGFFLKGIFTNPTQVVVQDHRIDSIYLIKDSLVQEIDTIYYQLEENNSKYEEDLSTIISNTVSEDYVFFRDYINANRSRLDSIQTDLYNLKYE